jgi:HEAT repeat protein
MKKSFLRSCIFKTYLKSKNAQKRKEALNYFAETKDKSALKQIIKSFCEGNNNALDVLNKIDTEWVKLKQTKTLVPELILMLNTTPLNVYTYKKIQHITEILGIIGDERAIPLLIKTMSRKILALDFEKIKLIRHTARQSVERFGIKATNQLIIELEKSDDDLKILIIQIFGQIKDSSTLPLLIKFASEYVGSCQNEAIEALSKFGKEGVFPLQTLLDIVEDYKKGLVILAIAQTKCEEANEILKKLLNVPEYKIREYAVEGIGKYNYPGYEDELIRLLNDKLISKTVVEALGRLKSAKSLEKIISIRAKNRNISYEVAWALGEIGGPMAIAELKRILNGNSDIAIRTEAIDSLIKLKPGDLENIIISHIEDRHSYVARESINAAREMKIPSALKILVSKLKIENVYKDNLISEISWAIAAINPDKAMIELLRIEEKFYIYKVDINDFTEKIDIIHLFYYLIKEIFNKYLNQISPEVLIKVLNYQSNYVLKAYQDDSRPYTKEARSSKIFDFSLLQTVAKKELQHRGINFN